MINTPSQNLMPQFDPQKLADIKLPEPVSYWPPAPGWWLLLGTIIILLIITPLLIRAYKKRPVSDARIKKQLKTMAQREFERIKNDYKEHQLAHKALQQLSILLRRYALSIYPRQEVAALTDQQWLHLLDNITGDKQFSEQYAELLIQAPYQSEHTPVDKDQLSQLFKASQTLLSTPVANTTNRRKTGSTESGAAHV
jgi:hypothetical protein